MRSPTLSSPTTTLTTPTCFISDRTGAMLEVLIAVDDQSAEIAFHAMRIRHKYRSLLS
jgi:hypothetical protein